MNDLTLTLDGHVLRLSDEILMQCATSEPIEPGQPSRASSSGTRGTPPGRDAQEAMHLDADGLSNTGKIQVTPKRSILGSFYSEDEVS